MTRPMILFAAGVMAGVTLIGSIAAIAAGGKMRLSPWQTDIAEMYLLCEQAGVQTVTLEEDGVTAVLACDPAAR